MFKQKRQEERISLFSIRDRVADDYGPLFQAKNTGVAIRNYQQFMEKVEFKQDYELWHIATMNKDLDIYQDKYIVNQLPEDQNETFIPAVAQEQL